MEEKAQGDVQVRDLGRDTGAGNGSAASPRQSIRDHVRAVKDDRKEIVHVEQWGVTVEVRSMTGKERATVLRKYLTDDNEIDYEALYPELVIATAFDPETGKPAFLTEDADWLADKNAGALELIGTVAMELSGLDRKARERAGKDSSATRGDGSSTT